MKNTCCPVIELRQYTLYPGKRDTLVSLFEEKFIESQEEVGMAIVAQFYDLDKANRFVWIRGFESMPARQKALEAFYYGPLWQANRDAANATLEDNDNVLLLRPASPGSGFALDGPRPATAGAPRRLLVATICYFEQEASSEFINSFDRDLLPLAQEHGARVLARYVSEKSPNTFERLPVRETENVFVWFAAFDDRQAYDRYVAKAAKDARWQGGWPASFARPPETLLLDPTPRSQLR